MEHLGDAYAELDDLDNAIKYYRISLKKGNTDPDAVKGKIEALLAESQSKDE